MSGLISPWELAALVSKSLSYLALAAMAGAALVLWLGRPSTPSAISLRAQRHVLNYLALAALIGIVAVCLFFLIEIGAINRRGLAGIFDQQMASIMAQSALGDGIQLKLTALALALLPFLLFLVPARHRRESWLWPVAWLSWPLAVLLAAASFAVLGHAANLGITGKFAASLHYVTIALWIGALYPLHVLCRLESWSSLAGVMTAFGRLAWGMVGGLVLSGLVLLWQLTGSLQGLFGTAYGQGLLAKLVLVAGLLMLAALNKFRLVPGLVEPGGARILSRSIALEMALALAILVLMATLTTLTGPPVMD